MADIYIIQLVGVILAIGGAMALTASAHIFGTPPSPADRRRASDEWNHRRNARRLPVNLDTIASMVFLLGGIGILAWSKFNLCAFLAYWLPPLPDLAKLLLSCQ